MLLTEVLFAAATVAWCQAMPLRLLGIYAICVAITFIGKWVIS